MILIAHVRSFLIVVARQRLRVPGHFIPILGAEALLAELTGISPAFLLKGVTTQSEQSHCATIRVP